MNNENSDIFILNRDKTPVKYLIKQDPKFEKIVNLVGEITYVPYKDPFVFLINTIVGQMLSNKVARILRDRILELCNGSVSIKKIEEISDSQLRNIGISYSKIGFIRNLTASIKNGILDFDKFQSMSDEEILNNLTKVRGIGSWTAKMFMIFVLNKEDVLPYEDTAFLQSYKWMYTTSKTTPSAVKKKCKKWSPYSSIAARYLYKALDKGLTKMPFE